MLRSTASTGVVDEGSREMMRGMGEERERRFVGVFAVVVVQGEAR